MMINYPDKYYELKEKCREYYIQAWNDKYDIPDWILDPNAPEEIKKDYAEAERIRK